MNGEYSNAENGGQDAKKRKRRALWALWAFVGAVALLGVAAVVWRVASVAENEATSPSSTQVRLTALEDALESARTERARIDALATKRESEARRLRSEFRRVFFRFDADERAALVDEMKNGALSPKSSARPEAATAFAKQREWLEVERERAALRKLSERFDAEIARAESERARCARRLESEETLGAAVAELDAENGSVEAVAVADRLRALTEDAASDADRPLESISPEEILALEETNESAFAALVGAAGAENSEAGEEHAVAQRGEKGKGEKDGGKGENGEKNATRETAGIPALPTFDPEAVPDDAPVAKRLFESQGKKIVDAANREIQNALDAGATDVAFAATNDAAAELVELAETLGKDRVEEFKKFQEKARRASWRPTLDALRESTQGLAESNAGWPETFALLEEAAALAPLAQIVEEDEAFERNLNDLQDLARYYESTDKDAGGAVRRRLDALLGKAEEAEKKAEAAEKKISNAFDELFDGASRDGDPVELVVGPIFGLLGALTLGTPLGVGILLFFLLTRNGRRGGKRWSRGDYERRFPVGDGGRFPFPTPETRPLPNDGALSGRNWQIIGLVFVIGLVTAGPVVAALAAFIAALVCAGRFGTALGALGIFAFLAFALVFIALATALAIVASIFVF
ncbi:MAG: hypothetical protein IKK39_12230 [Thermoguttaceae bacterium]|nr:hypothetical protein [Thermoguttaceae bacterium]